MHDDEGRRRTRERDVELAKPLATRGLLDDLRWLDDDHVVEFHPLRLARHQNRESLGLTGDEEFTITGITALNDGSTPRTVKVKAGDVEFDARVRIDTPGEANYYRNGGIMQYVLRSLRDA